MTGEYRIPATRQQVWAALNDPQVLKDCIPGCDTLEKTDDTHFEATVTSKVGPVKAKFKGAVTLSELDPPNGYTITGEGKGGAAGFAKGGAKVSLNEDGDTTVLSYEAQAAVGGKLAQLGSRLIDGTARKLADEFFTSFTERATQVPVAPAPGTPAALAAGDAPAEDAVDARVAVADDEVAEEPEAETPTDGEEAAQPLAAPITQPTPAAAARREPAPAPKREGLPTWIWVTGLVIIVALLLLVYG